MGKASFWIGVRFGFLPTHRFWVWMTPGSSLKRGVDSLSLIKASPFCKKYEYPSQVCHVRSPAELLSSMLVRPVLTFGIICCFCWVPGLHEWRIVMVFDGSGRFSYQCVLADNDLFFCLNIWLVVHVADVLVMLSSTDNVSLDQVVDCCWQLIVCSYKQFFKFLVHHKYNVELVYTENRNYKPLKFWSMLAWMQKLESCSTGIPTCPLENFSNSKIEVNDNESKILVREFETATCGRYGNERIHHTISSHKCSLIQTWETSHLSHT